ncbi:MAG: chloride channel protein family [Acidobacteriota bacterium]|jgi:CIC family chloride channel protein|nr:chloride channel protein family [Acidobacteriota bacterium]
MGETPETPETRSVGWLSRARDWARSLDFTLARRFGLANREDRLFFLLIGAVGVISGLLGLVTERCIALVQTLLWGRKGDFLALVTQVPRWLVVAAPAAGGAVVGLILWLGRRRSRGQAGGEAGGEGMAMLIEAVALTGGKIAPRPVLINALAAVVTVGSGGSLGREGPMIRLGAMISSWMGQRLELPPHRLKILVGCGAAAGLAATYNIPIGGTLFAMEVVLGNFALEIFGPIVVSSVIATLIARSLVGNAPLYATPDYTLANGWEMLLYAGLGIVGAVASVVFMVGVSWGGLAFKRLGELRLLPRPFQPVVGMTLLGVIGLWVPYVLGRGYGTINLTLAGKLPIPARLGLKPELVILLLLGIALMKLVATALTRGSGGAGGMFTPSLAFGALVGSAFGTWAHWAFPHTASPYGAYAAVGMAAVMAGTSHAPISAILILFEFTGNYDLILPVMVAAIIASTLSRRLRPLSIYTESLRGRGVELPWRMEEAVLAGLKAEDLARPDATILRPGDHYGDVVEKFLSTRRQRLFVVGEDGRLLGAISLHDIKSVLEQPDLLTVVVAHDLMVPVDRAILKDERLHRATEYFAHSDFERLPVVDGDGRYLGVLAKRDLLAVYAQEVLGRPALLATFVSGQESQAHRQYVEIPPDFSLRLVPVPHDLVGKTLAEARLPQTIGARVIEIKRQGKAGEEAVVPTAETVLQADDLLLLLGPTDKLEPLAQGHRADEALAQHQAE